jgi:diaminopimelate decarboxylase
MTPRALVAEHGSPLWLVDLDRVRRNVRTFRAAWEQHWPAVEVAYSYKTNRLPAILLAALDEGATPEVVADGEYLLARRVIGAPGEAIVVNGPAKPDRLLVRAGEDGALVIADSADELHRAAAAGVRRVGLRVRTPGVGDEQSRFGIPAAEVPDAARLARALGLELEALGAHAVSTGLRGGAAADRSLAAAVTVEWPPAGPERHVATARVLAQLARAVGVGTVDLGGGHPGAPGTAGHARAVCAALRDEGFAGRLLLEPGRAIVGDAVDLATTVVACKRLDDGTRCAIVDAGTNLLAGALWSWPRIETAEGGGAAAEPTLVTGPLCLNVDVLHPEARLPALAPGDLLLARGVGAYQQSQSTQFGEPRPAVVARDGGAWHLVARGESIESLTAGDLAASAAGAFIE